MARRVLVADDDQQIRELLKAFLTMRPGIIVLEACDAIEALEFMVHERIDLLITDLNMPDMHGLELLSFVRSNDSTRNVTVMMFTTERDRLSRRKAKALGVNVFVTKPFDPMAFDKVLGELLSECGAPMDCPAGLDR
ncbi:MAG: response regulator [Candidatus Riflebacteria bacterium]|nr:response regulator [Candidatus Riflebacteria bacterium]